MREKDMVDRIHLQQREIEAASFEHRQKMLQDMETLRMKESENKKCIDLEVTQLRVEKDRYHEKERELEKRLRELEDAKID